MDILNQLFKKSQRHLDVPTTTYYYLQSKKL